MEKIVILSPEVEKPRRSLSIVTGDWELYFPVGDLLDVDKEVSRLRGELAKLERETAKIEGKLSNKNFVDRAPAEVVEKERNALSDAVSQKGRIEENIASLM